MPAAQPPPKKPKIAYPQASRVHAFARAVVKGRRTKDSGRLARLACQRHLDDLKHGHKRGLIFRKEKAEAAISFFEDVLFLNEGQPFKLEETQVFIVGSLFGWYGADGFRRFHTAYLEMAKGNGKTPLAAGIGLYGMVVDDEKAPEVYSAAVSADQAGICFKDASRMVDSSPELKKKIQVQVGSLSMPSRYAVFRPLSAEHKTLDGKRVHIGIVDELHEHPSDIVVDKISAGTKQRQNALIFEITNSGHDRQSVCWRHHETSVTILEGRAHNDAWFAFICALDACPACHAAGKPQPDEKCPNCDDWRDEKVWRKANPGLDTILPRSYLRKQVGDAKTMTSKENIVKRLNFCLWTEQANRWLNMVEWDKCGREPIDLAGLRGMPAKAGLDASSTSDFTAFDLMFRKDGKFPLLPFLFLPEATLAERVRKTGLRFDLWAKQGHIFLTPGNQVDYAFIRKKIKELAESYNIGEIAFDPWNISDLVTQLQADGFTMVPVRQGFATLSPPSKEFEKYMLGGQLAHGGHPVLRWMAGNVATEEDAAGNIKPSKVRSSEKIDGIVAAIMALDRWIRSEPTTSGDPGILFM